MEIPNVDVLATRPHMLMNRIRRNWEKKHRSSKKQIKKFSFQSSLKVKQTENSTKFY